MGLYFSHKNQKGAAKNPNAGKDAVTLHAVVLLVANNGFIWNLTFSNTNVELFKIILKNL